MYCTPCTVYHVLYTVYCTPCTVHRVLYTVYCTPCTVHHVLYTVYCTRNHVLVVWVILDKMIQQLLCDQFLAKSAQYPISYFVSRHELLVSWNLSSEHCSLFSVISTSSSRISSSRISSGDHQSDAPAVHLWSAPQQSPQGWPSFLYHPTLVLLQMCYQQLREVVANEIRVSLTL